jgi:phytoene synthase
LSLTPVANREVIFAGSKTFSVASLFFNSKQRQGAWALYRWCRFVDDEIDNCASLDLLPQKLKEVQVKTREAFASEADPGTQTSAYSALAGAAQEFNLSQAQALDLVRGLEWDTHKNRVQNQSELVEYCYCVAGAVGLLMSSVMGVKNPKATAPAKALGEAMQMTNIARDIQEDLNRGRIYIPLTWMQEAGVTPDQFAQNIHAQIPLVQRLLDLADLSYERGFAGLCFLPFRAALAVASAGLIYQRIGHQIQKNPEYYLVNRSVVPLSQKLFLMSKALYLVLLSRRSYAP